jgi:hypothetical protein
MVNHVRTLLLNRPASAVTPMGEYVPPSFRTVALPSYLQQARGLLFGPRPDATMLDYRLRQYMALLHSTELVEFVTAPDPRITYTPGDRTMADFSFAPAVLPVGHDNLLYIVGDPPIATDGGMVYSWQVKVLLAGRPAPVAAVTQRSPVQGYVEHAISYTETLSNEFPLDGSPLLARFGSTGIVDGTTWIVTCLAPPAEDPGQVAATFRAVGGTILGQLFGGAIAEPYITGYSLWDSVQPLPYRLGAVLLAVATRTDEIRRGIS